jgi:hypothetical protein
VILAVREQVHLGRRRARRGEDAQLVLVLVALAGGGGDLRRLGIDGVGARHPLLQQEVGGAERRVGAEAALHRLAAQQRRQ